MDTLIKKRILLTFYSEAEWAFDSLSGDLQWDVSNSTAKPTSEKFLELEKVLTLNADKATKIELLNRDFNASKKITIQNGNTLIIEHDTPERDYFLQLIEIVSKLRPTEAVEYVQGKLGFRILSEIAAYIFKDLFTATLTNGTELNARKRNKTTIYNNALENINNVATQTELDAVTWNFLNPDGIIINVNNKAAEMLADPTVSDFAKAAINAAKDPITNEIHLVKTLAELVADS